MTEERQQLEIDATQAEDMLGGSLDDLDITEEGTDTDTETTTVDTETETVTEEPVETATEEPEETSEEDPTQAPVVDEAEILAQHGLGGQFGSVNDALAAIKHKDAELGRVRYDEALANRRAAEAATQPQERPAIDGEALLNDPDTVLAQAGYVRRDEVAHVARQAAMQVNDDNAYNEFAKNTSDFDAMKPAMAAKLQQYPGLSAIPMAEAARVLYTMCKQDSTPTPPPTVLTEPANAGKKERATTSGGKAVSATKVKTTGPMGPGNIPMEEFNKMSIDDIDKDPRFFIDPRG